MKTKLFAAGAIALLGASALGPGGTTARAEPTCADVLGTGLQVHGQHIVGDYVSGLGGLDGEMAWPPKGGIVGEAIKANGGPALPGGAGAHGHLLVDIAPGASFCNSQSNSPGFHIP